MTILSLQCRAARALIDCSREHLSELSGVAVAAIRDFEQKIHEPDEATKLKLMQALEHAGVVFIPEDSAGAGVRLKFTRRGVLAVKRWEGEGGMPAEDDL